MCRKQEAGSRKQGEAQSGRVQVSGSGSERGHRTAEVGGDRWVYDQHMLEELRTKRCRRSAPGWQEEVPVQWASQWGWVGDG